MSRPYRICTRCIMDTSDTDIRFDGGGVCNHCREYAPKSWNKLDGRNTESLFKKFSDKKCIESFPILTFRKYILFVYVRRLKVIPLLNYISYINSEAMAILQEKLGWVYYGEKHYESRLTQFYQAYTLPEKIPYRQEKSAFVQLNLFPFNKQG